QGLLRLILVKGRRCARSPPFNRFRQPYFWIIMVKDALAFAKMDAFFSIIETNEARNSQKFYVFFKNASRHASGTRRGCPSLVIITASTLASQSKRCSQRIFCAIITLAPRISLTCV